MSFFRIVFLPDFENFSAAIKPDAGDLCQCSASGDEKEKFMQDPGTGKYSCSSFPGIFPCDPVGKTAPYSVGRFPQMKIMQGFHGNGFVLIDLPIGIGSLSALQKSTGQMPCNLQGAGSGRRDGSQMRNLQKDFYGVSSCIFLNWMLQFPVVKFLITAENGKPPEASLFRRYRL